MADGAQSLALARRHCEDGAKRVQAQRDLIARMRADDPGAVAARSLLETLEDTQRLFLSDLRRLERATDPADDEGSPHRSES